MEADEASTLDQQSDAHAAADAQRRQASPRISTFHLVQQCGCDAHAGAANRMAQGNRAAVDIQLLRSDLKIAIAGNHLSSEGLVQLDEIDVGER